MNGMYDYYKVNHLSFRPELDFSGNDTRDSSGFKIT